MRIKLTTMQNPKPPTKNKLKHQLRWFKKGMYIIKNSNSDLFNPPILIESEQHAKALYINQTKGHRYTELDK